MAVQALSHEEILYLQKVASACRMSTADFVRNIVREYISHEENEPVYSTVADIEEADPEEAAEILALIDSMTDEDHEVVRVHRLNYDSQSKN